MQAGLNLLLSILAFELQFFCKKLLIFIINVYINERKILC